MSCENFHRDASDSLVGPIGSSFHLSSGVITAAGKFVVQPDEDEARFPRAMQKPSNSGEDDGEAANYLANAGQLINGELASGKRACFAKVKPDCAALRNFLSEGMRGGESLCDFSEFS